MIGHDESRAKQPKTPPHKKFYKQTEDAVFYSYKTMAYT